MKPSINCLQLCEYGGQLYPDDYLSSGSGLDRFVLGGLCGAAREREWDRIMHTKGPWKIVSKGGGRRVIRGQKSIVIIESWTDDSDARLIAAAPSLLDTLQQIIAAYHSPDGCLEKQIETAKELIKGI